MNQSIHTYDYNPKQEAATSMGRTWMKFYKGKKQKRKEVFYREAKKFENILYIGNSEGHEWAGLHKKSWITLKSSNYG